MKKKLNVNEIKIYCTRKTGLKRRNNTLNKNNESNTIRYSLFCQEKYCIRQYELCLKYLDQISKRICSLFRKIKENILYLFKKQYLFIATFKWLECRLNGSFITRQSSFHLIFSMFFKIDFSTSTFDIFRKKYISKRIYDRIRYFIFEFWIYIQIH